LKREKGWGTGEKTLPREWHRFQKPNKAACTTDATRRTLANTPMRGEASGKRKRGILTDGARLQWKVKSSTTDDNTKKTAHAERKRGDWQIQKPTSALLTIVGVNWA